MPPLKAGRLTSLRPVSAMSALTLAVAVFCFAFGACVALVVHAYYR